MSAWNDTTLPFRTDNGDGGDDHVVAAQWSSCPTTDTTKSTATTMTAPIQNDRLHYQPNLQWFHPHHQQQQQQRQSPLSLIDPGERRKSATATSWRRTTSSSSTIGTSTSSSKTTTPVPDSLSSCKLEDEREGEGGGGVAGGGKNAQKSGSVSHFLGTLPYSSSFSSSASSSYSPYSSYSYSSSPSSPTFTRRSSFPSIPLYSPSFSSTIITTANNPSFLLSSAAPSYASPSLSSGSASASASASTSLLLNDNDTPVASNTGSTSTSTSTGSGSHRTRHKSIASSNSASSNGHGHGHGHGNGNYNFHHHHYHGIISNSNNNNNNSNNDNDIDSNKNIIIGGCTETRSNARSFSLIINSLKSSLITPPIDDHKDVPWNPASNRKFVDHYGTTNPDTTNTTSTATTTAATTAATTAPTTTATITTTPVTAVTTPTTATAATAAAAAAAAAAEPLTPKTPTSTTLPCMDNPTDSSISSHLRNQKHETSEGCQLQNQCQYRLSDHDVTPTPTPTITATATSTRSSSRSRSRSSNPTAANSTTSSSPTNAVSVLNKTATATTAITTTGAGTGPSKAECSEERGEEQVDDDDQRSPLLNGISVAVSQLNVQSERHPTLHILSQTLPCPVPVDEPSTHPPAAFPHVVAEICSATKTGEHPYVTITHAMPPKSSLSSLPTSPPSTPNLTADDDYFNFRVFSSATPAPGYDTANCSMSTVKTPIVPPESVHAAVIERYMPPSSQLEYDNIFSAGLKSVLVDRFRELSSDGGTLTLIYPTKKGVHTFKKDHLGPLLDPVIRRLIVTKSISFDVARHLENMPSVAQIDDYEDMRAKIIKICEEVNERNRQSENTTAAEATTATTAAPLGGDGLSLVYSSTEEIRISRKVWREWYFFQGAPRAKAALNNYWRSTHRSPSFTTLNSGCGIGGSAGLGDCSSGSRRASKAASYPCASSPSSTSSSSSLSSHQTRLETTSTMILQEIYDGLRADKGTEPESGIDVGIFIIRRSRQGCDASGPSGGGGSAAAAAATGATTPSSVVSASSTTVSEVPSTSA